MKTIMFIALLAFANVARADVYTDLMADMQDKLGQGITITMPEVKKSDECAKSDEELLVDIRVGDKAAEKCFWTPVFTAAQK